MLYSVSDKIKSKTTKCPHDFSCLETGLCDNPEKCEVQSDFDKNMLIVKFQKPIDILCPYHLAYGNGSGHMCTCPTLYAIYMKNKRQALYKR